MSLNDICKFNKKLINQNPACFQCLYLFYVKFIVNNLWNQRINLSGKIKSNSPTVDLAHYNCLPNRTKTVHRQSSLEPGIFEFLCVYLYGYGVGLDQHITQSVQYIFHQNEK